MSLVYDFKYKPEDPDAYKRLMSMIGPSIRKSPIKKDTKKNRRRQRGKVLWFDPKKNYGFIMSDDKKEYFIHRDDSEVTPIRGDIVTFEAKETEKGLRAVNLKKERRMKK